MVPEAARATIYNVFRIPLNAVVLGVLLNQMEVRPYVEAIGGQAQCPLTHLNGGEAVR